MRIPAKEELINKTNNKSKDIMLEKRLNFLKDFMKVLRDHRAVISKDINSSDLNYTMLDDNFNGTYLLAKHGAISYWDISDQIKLILLTN